MINEMKPNPFSHIFECPKSLKFCKYYYSFTTYLSNYLNDKYKSLHCICQKKLNSDINQNSKITDKNQNNQTFQLVSL